MSPTNGKHKQLLLASLLAIVLLGSSMFAQNFSAYADKGSKNDDNKNNQQQAEHDDHKKGKKDPDKDKDNDRKECKNGDTKKNGKYKHNCDSDHEHFA